MKIKSFLKLKDSETASVTGLNTYLEELSEACRFRRWFFGSMHLDKYISNSHVAVYYNVINTITGEVQRYKINPSLLTDFLFCGIAFVPAMEYNYNNNYLR